MSFGSYNNTCSHASMIMNDKHSTFIRNVALYITYYIVLGTSQHASFQCFVGINGFINKDNDDYCSQVEMEMKDIFRGSGVKKVRQNIHSLLPKIDELRLLISSVQSKIDPITLSETWLTDVS